MNAILKNLALRPENSGNPKILVVDDKFENRLAIKQLLKKHDAEFIEADSGNNALKAVLHNDFALILLDVQMPDMDGIEVLEILQNDPDSKHVPVILITADHSENARYIKAYEHGAVDFLYKPIVPGVLISKVRVFLDLYKTQYYLKKLSIQHELILNSAGEGICSIDNNGIIISCNPSAQRIAEKTLTGIAITELICMQTGEDRNANSKEDFYRVIRNRGTFRSDGYEIKTLNGYTVPVSISITPISSSEDSEVAAVFVFSDISESKKMERRLIKLARFDSLTGLANRTLFYENLSKSIARANRHQSKFALFFIDMDQFKEVNDTLGHSAGDSLLVQFAQRIYNFFRVEDSISRIGGDEFTIIVEDIHSYKDPANLANKLLDSTKKPFMLNGKEYYTTISIGIALYPEAGTDIETLTRNADTAMYRAKESGRNSYQFFSKNLMQRITQKVETEHELRQALKDDKLELFYQPKVNLINGKITGFEALIRWNHPVRGFIPPESFISIAEDTDLIIDIGDWVLRKACEQKQLWNKVGQRKDIKLAINISAKQLSKSDFISSLLAMLKQYDTCDLALEFELTETAVMQNVHRATQMLEKVHDMGISVAIDDFGMGYSSLSQLKRLPVDTLKIDKSFIRDINSNNNDAAIVKAIINIAESMDLNVIAEGIETKQQLDLLLNYKCLEGQGFHFFKPMPASEIAIEMLC